MEVICSYETLGSVQTTRRYSPENRTPHSQRGENVKSNQLIHLQYILFEVPRVFNVLKYIPPGFLVSVSATWGNEE
jgi:hypothetical protein